SAAFGQRRNGRTAVTRALVLAVMFFTAAAAAAQQQEAPPPPPPQQGPQPLTLDDAVKLSLQRNPDLQRQILLTLSAEQDKVLARSNILPVIGLNASISRVRTNGNQFDPVTGTFPNGTTHQWNYTGRFAVSQLIFDGGKWWNNMAASDRAYRSNLAQTD